MILLVDNYDSFSYNLYQLVGAVRPDIRVIRNDECTVEEIRSMPPEAVILSPGPGRPADAGICEELIRSLTGSVPILGVCLGHQAIGEVFGARLENLSDVFHGVATPCHITAADPIFAGLDSDITVGRYHSWVVAADDFPACLEVTAVSDEGLRVGDGTSGMGQIMALRHRQYDVHGIQFHPESVLTPEGKTIIKNFIDL